MMKANPTLVAGVRGCKACPLHLTRTLAIPGWVGEKYAGTLGAICEAPSFNEDQQGKPLVGRAGELFDEILSQLGIDRESLFITHMVRCRPLSNDLSRVPEAVVACNSWLKEELNAYQPKVILLMGRTAIESAFGKVAVGAIRGTYTKLDGIVYVATYHPAAALRNRDLIPHIMEDVELARQLSESYKETH